jgi:HlyD family secretion protein
MTTPLLPSPHAATPRYRGSLSTIAAKGAFVLTIFFGAGGLWAGVAPLTGAVLASGQLVVGSNVKSVQHPTGGVVAEVAVRDGDRVREGQVLLRLDETITAATLASAEKKIDELEARAARLEAERFGFQPLAFPPSLTARAGDAQVKEILTTETALYNARRDAHQQSTSRLQERIKQLRQEIVGLEVEQVARDKLEVVTVKELDGLRHLDKLKLVQFGRLSQVERDAINLERQKGQLAAQIAQARGRIIETELQIAGLDDQLRVDTTKELREVQAQLAQEREKRVAALDQQQRVEIRSPSAGYVHQNIAHTVGGVIKAGEPIMLVVPENDPLEVEVRVNPPDIDQVHIGQPARIQLQAFNRRTTPKIAGSVSRIAADVSKDQQTGALYYTVRIRPAAEEIAKLGEVKLTAGMLADAFITTADRTAFDYLTRPLYDQIARAMNER